MASQPPAANQATPVRPWFRLGSMARPAPTPTPTPTPEVQPQPTAPQPRPPLARPAITVPFRPPTDQPQPTQPQEPAPQPPLPAAVAAAVAAAAPAPPPAGAVAPPLPAVPPPPAVTSGSVPTSPISKTIVSSSSLPTSPAPKAVPPTTVPTVGSSSVPSSPKPKAAQSSSVPTSPAQKSAPSSSVPTSPAPKAAPFSSVPTSQAPRLAPSSSVPSSPTIKAATTATTASVPMPVQSPKTIKPFAQTPPQSPKIKPQAPPPSPLTLPPSQLKSDAEPEPKIPLEAEQKNVLVQKTIEKPKAIFNGDAQSDVRDTRKPSIMHNGKHEVTKNVETKEKGFHKKFTSDSEEGGMRVITLAGENRGAFMELGPSHKKHDFEGKPHSLQKKNNPTARKTGESRSSSSSSDEGMSKMKDKSHNTVAMSSPPMTAFMNSNVQGVNNSILHNTSFTHHDPGVHLSLSRKPTGDLGIHLKDKANGHHS